MLVTNNGVHYNASRVYEVIDYVNWIKGIYHIIHPKVTTAYPTRAIIWLFRARVKVGKYARLAQMGTTFHYWWY